MKSELAIVGLVVGIVGLIVAMAIRQRWARPVGAGLIALAVVAEIAAVQAHGNKQAAGDGGGASLTPIATATTASPSPSSRPTSSPTGTFAITPHLLALVHPGIDPIVKAGTVNKEYVRLSNVGKVTYSMGGWRLSNGSVTFVFPAMSLKPNSTIVVKTGTGTTITVVSGSKTTTTLHWNLSSYVWSHPRGTIWLRNPQQKIINLCKYVVPKGQTSAGC